VSRRARLARWAWIAFLASVPVSSFPFLPQAMGGGALVRPLTIYPLLLLLPLVTLPRLWRDRLPRTFLSLLPFLTTVLAGVLLAALRGIEPVLDVTVEDRMLRALLTLGLGVAMYLTTALWPQTIADLRLSLRALYAGFGVALAWGTLQVSYIVLPIPGLYNVLNRLQKLVSIRRLMVNRVSGMTYEPNWFAEQLTFVLLPWLLAAVLTGTSVFTWRFKRRVTVEMLLLGWAVGLLPFTFSRAGLASLGLLVALSLLFLLARRPPTADAAPRRARWGGWGLRLAQTLGGLALLGGLIFAAGSRNEFFARVWNYWLNTPNPNVSDYLEYLGFGARFLYSETAYNTFDAYPLLGVGVGNYAFYFQEMLPDRPLAYTVEVLRLITPEAGRNRLITAKNFYFRLLAETGLIGTAAFLAFLAAVWGGALFLLYTPVKEVQFWGIGGVLSLTVFLSAALSFDSFAIPNLWIVFGLITAAAWIHAQPEKLWHAGSLPGAEEMG
jgi:hypothetical protein